MVRTIGWREPSLERRYSQRRHASGANRRDPLLPHFHASDARRRVGKDQPLQTLRRMNPKPESHHPSQRQSTHTRSVRLHLIQQAHHIASQLLDGERFGRNAALTVTTHVEAQDPVPGLESRQHLVPHVQIRSQPIDQHEKSPAWLAAHLIVQARAVVLSRWHFDPPQLG